MSSLADEKRQKGYTRSHLKDENGVIKVIEREVRKREKNILKGRRRLKRWNAQLKM